MRIAGIDIGTNSVRLLVADVAGARVEELAVRRVATRLGEGMSGGRLVEAAVTRTIEALAGFLAEIRALRPDKVVAVATAAVRDAGNGREFVGRVRDSLGLEVRVPGGGEEALYSWYGAHSGVPTSGRPVVVMDLGGGSTEFTWTEGGQVTAASVPVGAVRLFEAGGGGGEAADLLAPALTRIRGARGPQSPEPGELMMIGVGGTVTTAAAMQMGLAAYERGRVHGRELSRADVARLAALVAACPPARRASLPGLDRERADIIPAGLAIMVAALDGLGLDSLVVSERGLLHGLVLDAAGTAR